MGFIMQSAMQPNIACSNPFFSYRYLGITRFDQSTWKWSVVLRTVADPGYHFVKTTYVFVGNLQMVEDCLVGVSRKLVNDNK